MFRRTLLVLRVALSLLCTVGLLVGVVPALAAPAFSSVRPFAAAAISPRVVSSFPVPGGRVLGLSWGDGSLWLADENQRIFRLSSTGTVQGSFTTAISDISDLGWHENSLWAHDGDKVYQLNSLGEIISSLDVGYWWNSGMEWAGESLFVGDYNFGEIHQHDRAGAHILSWETSFFGHPEDMAFDGVGLWIADSCEGGENGLWRYSLLGALQEEINLDTVEACDHNSDRAVAWDGRYLWYGASFTIYQLDLAGLFPDSGVTSLPGLSASSAAWGDYDGDRDLDVLLTGLAANIPISRIYRNDDGGAFTEEVAASLIGIHDGSAVWGDYDNDGDLDILLTGCTDSSCASRVTRIYRNDGSGQFTRSSAQLLGLSSGAAAWGDYDNDGDLDILLLGHTGSAGATRIYRNDGNDIFTDIHVNMTHQYGSYPFELFAGSVAWGDFDNDRDLDALLIGCYTATCFQTSMDLYRNEGGDTFERVIDEGGARDSSVSWGDYDNDGDLDILFAGNSGWAASARTITKIYRNDGGTVFTDIGAALVGVRAGSASWGDYDNDGDLDILLTGGETKVYRNDGYDEFAAESVFVKSISDGFAAWGDYDNDDDLDILITGRDALAGNGITRIFRNGITTSNSPPSAPSDLMASVTSTSADLSWHASSDAQTPAAGLSYNLYVGRSPGSLEILAPMSDMGTGYRYIPALGNANQGSTALLTALMPGTRYYWSVQAVDTAFASSPFTTQGSFVTAAAPSPRTTVWLPFVAKQSAPTPATVTLASIADACVLEGDPTFNAGTTGDMWVGYDDYLEPDGKIVRSLVGFDLSGIPASTEVSEAKLRLFYLSYWDVPGYVDTVTAYRAAGDWQERTVTWQTQPGYESAYGSVDVPATASWGWRTIDVTELVRGWVSGAIPNQGIVLRGPEASGAESSWRGFSTREGPYPPELVVTYQGTGGAAKAPEMTMLSGGRAASIADLLSDAGRTENSIGRQLRFMR